MTVLWGMILVMTPPVVSIPGPTREPLPGVRHLSFQRCMTSIFWDSLFDVKHSTLRGLHSRTTGGRGGVHMRCGVRMHGGVRVGSRQDKGGGGTGADSTPGRNVQVVSRARAGMSYNDELTY